MMAERTLVKEALTKVADQSTKCENMTKDEDSDDGEDKITPKRSVRPRIESDKENEVDEDEDEISPVRRRRRQLLSDESESDSETTPSNRLRQSKRKSDLNLDSAEEETFNSDEHKPDSDQHSGSPQKKKFRRIQLPESSQELESSYPCNSHRSCSVLDGTDSDTDSQETIEYNPEEVIVVSDDESSNDSDTTAGDDGSSIESSNESSSSDSDLEDSSLQDRLNEANKHSIFQPLTVVFQLIVLQAAGEEEGVQEVKKYAFKEIESLDKQIESRLNLCQSQAWCERAATAIRRFPEFVTVSRHDDLSGGDIGHIGDCEVCKRELHPWEYEVNFQGEPYNSLTFSQENSLAEEEDELDLRFMMGRYCFERSKAFHRLFHWKFHLYQTCKKRLENASLDSLQKDKNLLLQTFYFLKKWIHRVTEDYTLDGEKRRGNKRYWREYGDMY